MTEFFDARWHPESTFFEEHILRCMAQRKVRGLALPTRVRVHPVNYLAVVGRLMAKREIDEAGENEFITLHTSGVKLRVYPHPDVDERAAVFL